MLVNIAFIGFGEVSFCIAKGLRKDFPGQHHITATDTMIGSGKPYEKLLWERASEAGVSLFPHAGEAAENADIVFLAVPGAYAKEAGMNALDVIGGNSVFIDLTTASPYDKLALEKAFSDRGVLYADSAMLGPLPVYMHKVPMLISGRGAERSLELMSALNMDVTLVEGEAGTASKIKLIRSVFMKGLQALLVETFLFARKERVEQTILDSISKTMNAVPFQDTVRRMVTADTIHAGRRAHEVGDSIALMGEIGINPLVASASEARLLASAALGTREELGGKAPASLEEVFSIWDEKSYS